MPHWYDFFVVMNSTLEKVMNQTSKCGSWIVQGPVARAGVCASLLALACGGDEADRSASAGESVPPEPRQLEELSALPGGDSAQLDSVQSGSVSEAATASEPESSATASVGSGVVETAEPSARCSASISFDELYAAIDADLRSEDDEDAVFIRYVSLGHRINQGLCPEALEGDRLALVKTLNSLSTEVRVVLPEAIDENGVIYRIDLRDLGWDQATQVGTVSFTNKWEAIIATSPYAVELEGEDADDAKLAAQTGVPVLFSDALIDATVVGDLYYSLVNIGENAFDLFGQLGIDFADTPVRAGTSNSRMSRQDTIIQRLEPGAQGFYWSRFDVADTTVGQSIFTSPFTFFGDTIASLFTLPNGFIAYALFDAAGARLAETDILVDASQRDGHVRTSVSCSGCHAAGVNRVTDEVREYVESNRIDFDGDTFDDVQEQFLLQPELDEVVSGDIAAYQSTLARAGLASTGVDPISTVYKRFDGPVTLEVAAGELGITPEALSTELVALSDEADPILATLRTQSLRREQFEAAYVTTLCSLLVSNENRPVSAACDASP
jgi:hypothetical protein